MATIVCQGLQSSLESQRVESRTLRLRLSSYPKPHLCRSLELAVKQSSPEEISDRRNPDDDRNAYPSPIQNPDVEFWSFFQDLSNGPFSSQEIMEKENVYGHPNGFSSILSEKSLELCTENLGNETGTIDIMETSRIFSSPLSSLSESESEEGGKGCQDLGGKKTKCKGEFPPPLTTMRGGSESLQVRSHREDGRLIIKAIKTPLENKNFQAERSEGRLRLRLFKDSASNFDLKKKKKRMK